MNGGHYDRGEGMSTTPPHTPGDPAPGPGEVGFERRTAEPSGWVAFWPHQEAPTSEEVVQAFAAWVGAPLDASQAENSDDTRDMLWHAIVQVPSIDAAVVAWAEAAEPLRAELPSDHPLSACRWVVRIQSVLGTGDPAADYFLLVSMLAGALVDSPAVLDVVTGQVLMRPELEAWFLAPESLPSDHFLWRVGGVMAELGDGDQRRRLAMLHTTGLARCGRPELEILEIPEDHVQAGLALLNAAAGLVLDGPLPAPGEPLELGPDLAVVLQPWQAVAVTMEDAAPGSRAFRAALTGDAGDALAGPRAVLCDPAPAGAWTRAWTWPRSAISRLESGRAVIYSSGRATLAAARRAQRTWPSFATAFASLKRSDDPGLRKLATDSFMVQAPLVDGSDPERAEQAWFLVQRLDGERVEGRLTAAPVTRPDLSEGDTVPIEREAITDWRASLSDHEFGPDEPAALLSEVDRLRGL